MTGYGEASAQIDGVHYSVEVRALNNKYFKATIRLAEIYQGLEPEMESRLREKLARGTVTLSARCTDASESAAYEVNTRALARYVQQLRQIHDGLGERTPVDLAGLLLLPGVLQPPGSADAIIDKARKGFMPLLDTAVTALIGMREREGKVLADDIRDHLQLITTRLGEISKLAPAVIAEYEARLRQRIELLLRDMGSSIQPPDVVREIAVYAERTDIAEELKRLSAHVDQFHELLASKDNKPVGRTLDFLAQEMLREANTIASKSPDAAIARATVEIKGAIDRVKEQVQNLE
jgi:uncharacterized protein (TIGR00255 family)